jgi:hypothetical protein
MAKDRPSPQPAGPVALKWREDVADHDYAAAHAYLSLRLDERTADEAVSKLRRAKLTTRRANDILRATGLDPAPLDDPGVVKDVIKVIEGKALSPVLVIKSAAGSDIADGYHRVSMAYRVDPYAEVPLKLAAVSGK